MYTSYVKQVRQRLRRVSHTEVFLVLHWSTCIGVISVGFCSGLHIISPVVRFLGSGLKEAMIHGMILNLVCEFYHKKVIYIFLLHGS